MPSPVNRAGPAGRVIVRGDLLFARTRADSPEELAHDYAAWELPGDPPPPYLRPAVNVGPEWSELPLRWDPADPPPAVLHVRHLAGSSRQVIPSPEELAAEDRLVVEIGVDGAGTTLGEPGVAAFALVQPGRAPARFTPLPGLRYHLRCPAGPCRVAVVTVPSAPAPAPPRGA